MNWLNSIDNILEHGFVRRRPDDSDEDDTNYSDSSGTDELDEDESSTWLEEDGESSPRHVQLSLRHSTSMNQEDEADSAEDNGQAEALAGGENTNPMISPPPQPLQRTIQQQEKPRPWSTQQVRPGNIRLRLKRSVSSSSEEEEGEDESKKEDKSGEENDAPARAAAVVRPRANDRPGESKKQKPEPIPISDHESLLSSLRASRSSHSMEETTSSGIPMSVQDTDTSSTNHSPPSHIESNTPTTLIEGQQSEALVPIQQLSYVSKIKTVISNSQSSANSKGNHLQQQVQKPRLTLPQSGDLMSNKLLTNDEILKASSGNEAATQPPIMSAASKKVGESDTQQIKQNPLKASASQEQLPECSIPIEQFQSPMESTTYMAEEFGSAEVQQIKRASSSSYEQPESSFASPMVEAFTPEEATTTSHLSTVALTPTPTNEQSGIGREEEEGLPPTIPYAAPHEELEGHLSNHHQIDQYISQAQQSPVSSPTSTQPEDLTRSNTTDDVIFDDEQQKPELHSQLASRYPVVDQDTTEDPYGQEFQISLSKDCSIEPEITRIQSNQQPRLGTMDQPALQSHSTPNSPSFQQPTYAGMGHVATMWATETYSTPELSSPGYGMGPLVASENHFPSNPSSVSSGWSWPESQGGDGGVNNCNDDDSVVTSDDNNEPKSLHRQQTIIETGSSKEEVETQQPDVANNGGQDMKPKTSSDEFTDEEVKTMASELEELRELVEAVGADSELMAPAIDTFREGPQAATMHDTVNLENQWDDSSRQPELGQNGGAQDDFHDAVSNHGHSSNDECEVGNFTEATSKYPSEEPDKFSGPQGDDSSEHNQSSSDPNLVPKSERTLLASNLDLSSRSGNANADTTEGSEPSFDLPEVDDENGKDDNPKAANDNDHGEPRQDPKLFEVKRVSGTWREETASFPLDAVNCYGAFHIRVLRAQRLPCPGGSTVQANVFLLPWKGRARTSRRTTFLLDNESAAFDHGVCAEWDELNTLSLVHAYASEATPIPTIKMELMLSPVKMLEFSICSLTLPCNILMKRPGSWMRQWFLTELSDTKTTKDGQVFGGDQIPMVEMEAVFVPEDQSLGTSFVALDKSNHVANGEELDIERVPSRDRADTAESVSDSIAGRQLANEQGKEAKLVPSGKPHLLRYKKFWKPATCGQCGTSLLGWKTKSFRCEACGIDCCEDCRLHLDVQIPCGSSQCTQIVSKAIQNKLTLTSFLEAMAPVDEEYAKKRELVKTSADGESSMTDTKTEGGTVSRAGEKGRIGVLKLNIARACVFKYSIPAVSEPDEVVGHDGELRPGDYYVRVCRTGSISSARTRTIPSAGKLKFEEASEMRLDVTHYDVNFFIEVVDAITDKPLGTSVLTTQALLQQQRDLMIEDGQMSMLTFGAKPPTFKGKRRMTLELRAGVKSGVSGDFFVPSDASEEQGKISGWVELSVGLEEDVKRLFGATPYECPAPPPDPLNLKTLELHISRLSDFVEDIVNLFATYQYVVSWRSPILTGFAFSLFLAFTIKFDSEYVGCLPFLFIMMCMLASAFSRSNAKKRFVQEEADEWKAAEKDIDVNYTLHRPIGRISVSVSKANHIRSRDLGLAGNVGCRVYLDPLRFGSEKQKEKLVSLDKSAKTIHEVGSTDYKFTINPVWGSIIESEECRRLKQVLPHHGHFFETEEDIAKEAGCEFPVLQPFRRVDDDDDNTSHVNATLEPWKASTAGVVFQIRFSDILNMLPGSDHIFGEVALPLANVVQQREMSGWFQILDVGTKDYARVNEKPSEGQVEGTPVVGEAADRQAGGHDVPMVFLTVKWFPPEERLDSEEARETDREASVVIQEELLRWESTNRDRDKLKQLVVGGSIGAFKTVSGFAGTLQVIQNFLGKIANTLEAVRNLMNFTDPFKSSLVLAVVTLLWVVLSLLPTRLILLIAGLAQFGITAKIRVDKILRETGDTDGDDSSVASDLDEDEEGADALIVWLKNAFRGLPTDEDLRKAYFWEGRRIGVKTKESYAAEKRMARLKRLWRAQWHAMIKIRTDGNSKKQKSSCTWEAIFAVVQGRRLLWWKTVSDFDKGIPPKGRIFLAGHAGLSGLSPLEMREIDPKDVPLVVGIFGKGLQGQQQKVTLLLPGNDLKDSLESVVIEASIKEASCSHVG